LPTSLGDAVHQAGGDSWPRLTTATSSASRPGRLSSRRYPGVCCVNRTTMLLYRTGRCGATLGWGWDGVGEFRAHAVLPRSACARSSTVRL